MIGKTISHYKIFEKLGEGAWVRFDPRCPVPLQSGNMPSEPERRDVLEQLAWLEKARAVLRTLKRNCPGRLTFLRGESASQVCI